MRVRIGESGTLAGRGGIAEEITATVLTVVEGVGVQETTVPQATLNHRQLERNIEHGNPEQHDQIYRLAHLKTTVGKSPITPSIFKL